MLTSENNSNQLHLKLLLKINLLKFLLSVTNAKRLHLRVYKLGTEIFIVRKSSGSNFQENIIYSVLYYCTQFYFVTKQKFK